MEIYTRNKYNTFESTFQITIEQAESNQAVALFQQMAMILMMMLMCCLCISCCSLICRLRCKSAERLANRVEYGNQVANEDDIVSENASRQSGARRRFN